MKAVALQVIIYQETIFLLQKVAIFLSISASVEWPHDNLAELAQAPLPPVSMCIDCSGTAYINSMPVMSPATVLSAFPYSMTLHDDYQYNSNGYISNY